jgi:SAM-dependent methyltransferase
MKTWQEIEALADENGFIPEAIYKEHVGNFPVCPPQHPEARRIEDEVWRTYLSTTRRRDKRSQMYQEMFRYEWYEGRRRRGFWGNIEKALGLLEPEQCRVISILSAGSGRDLIKVGLATGVFASTVPAKIRGTWREIDKQYLRLARPDARILMTEFDGNSLASLRRTVAALNDAGVLTPEMTAVRKWDFRLAAPLATGTQDVIVFSLTGNYATIEEQPLILREIARCLKPGGHLVASAMTDQLDFHKARSHWGKLKLALTTPLAWPVALDFIPWQIRWAKMAGKMNDKGYWRNVSAAVWMKFLEPAGMEQVRIYPGPSDFLPVEVLVARKI